SVAMFEESRIHDPALRPVMNRIKVSENPEFTRAFPKAMMNRIEIVARDGKRHAAEGRYPRGHEHNPMTDAEVEQKYHVLCDAALGKERSDRLLGTLWALEREANISEVLDLVQVANV